MVDELVRLLKNSAIYFLGIVLSKALGFFLIPLYTRNLAPGDYGVLEMLDLILFFAGIFASMGIYSAVFRFYSLCSSEEEKKEVIATALLFCAGTSLVISATMMLLAEPLAQALLGDGALAPLVRIVAQTFLFSNLAEVPLAYWRAQEKTTRYVAISLARAVLMAALLVLALAGVHAGVRGALYANLAANALVGASLFAAALSSLPRRIYPARLQAMLGYSVPLIAATLAQFILGFSDRFFLRYFANLSEVGIYALGYKLAAIVTVIVSVPFSMTWQWQQFELAKRQDARQLYAKLLTYVFMVSLFLALAVSLLARDALRIMVPESYWTAASVVPLLALSYVLADARMVILSGVLVQQATRQLAAIAALVAAANLLLNYLLIPRYLAMGAALATLLSFVLSLLLAWVLAQRVFYVPYEYARNALVLGMAGLVLLAGRSLSLPLASSVLANLGLLAGFAICGLAVLGRDERALIGELARGLRQRLHRNGPTRQAETVLTVMEARIGPAGEMSSK